MPKDAAADPPDADRDAASGRPEEVAARESGLSTAATVPAETLPAIQSAALAGGEAAWVSIKAPEKNGLCEEDDVVMRSNQPGELKARVTRAKKGLLDEEEEQDEDEDEE